MSILSPSGLETISYRQQGWNAIITRNLQLMNGFWSKVWGPITATYALGVPTCTDSIGSAENIITEVEDITDTVTDPASITQEDVTDSSGGTPVTNIAAVSGSGADTEINDNFASIATQLEKIKYDTTQVNNHLRDTIDYCDNLKAKVNEVIDYCDDLKVKDADLIDYSDEVRDKFNELLSDLRITNGCGVLSD